MFANDALPAKMYSWVALCIYKDVVIITARSYSVSVFKLFFKSNCSTSLVLFLIPDSSYLMDKLLDYIRCIGNSCKRFSLALAVQYITRYVDSVGFPLYLMSLWF